MQRFAIASLVVVAIAAACGSSVESSPGPVGTGGAASASSSPSASTGNVTVGPGPTSSTGPSCPPHSSPGCCFGDGACCDCVSSQVCAIDSFMVPDAAMEAFDDCA